MASGAKGLKDLYQRASVCLITPGAKTSPCIRFIFYLHAHISKQEYKKKLNLLILTCGFLKGQYDVK